MAFTPLLSYLPAPAQKRIAMRITPAAERALRSGHPWIFDQSITRQSHPGQPGDLAVIFDSKRRFLAVGLYDPASAIRVRILQSRDPADINAGWFQIRLAAAAALRAPLTELPPESATTGFRLVHGENDGLPGLVIDRYADTLVLKLYTAAWIPHLNEFCAALKSVAQTPSPAWKLPESSGTAGTPNSAGFARPTVIPAEQVILRFSRALAKNPAALSGLTDGLLLAGAPLTGPLLFLENGLTFESDPILGQKTGFFLDQRDNRARVERLSRDQTVLNLFAYTGGFSVYAARGGARHVTSIDISAPALQAAARNFAHNQAHPAVAAAAHETCAEDAFIALERLAAEKRLFDLVIIDPPMFAHAQDQVTAALAAYRRLTRLGLAILRPGGILVQASCSSRVPAEDFFTAIHHAASEAHRSLVEIERTAHPLDHPITYKEGAYLKCLFAHVS
ncbi:MAG: class I SAM-dependent rRNA methyltransferase [Anaerolineae bacterium]|nr:MAG: class I SAM-dependent rRNA methyltransferase [Anaerolineae bacterium]